MEALNLATGSQISGEDTSSSESSSEGEATDYLKLLSLQTQKDSAYVICLVGFTEPIAQGKTESDNTATLRSLSELLPHIVPEATIYEYTAFRRRGKSKSERSDAHLKSLKYPPTTDQSLSNENGTKKTLPSEVSEKPADKPNHNEKSADSERSHFSGYLYLDTIQNDAVTLLNALRARLYAGSPELSGKNIVLAGYGIGGLVIKRAAILANSNPLYYGIAVQLSNLIFFGTPHRHDNLVAWENLLLSIVQQSNLKMEGLISETLQGIAATALEVSLAFYSLIRKYFVVNIIDGKGVNGNQNPIVGELGKVCRETESHSVIRKKNYDLSRLAWFDKSAVEDLQEIRNLFAPKNIFLGEGEPWKKLAQIADLGGNSRKSPLYLQFLKVLSPSRWFIHRSESIATADFTLARIYAKQVVGLKLESLSAGESLQIIGSVGLGKASVLRLVCQHLREQTDRVTVEYFFEPTRTVDTTTYGMLLGCLHQVFSQRPDLFSAIQPLIIEYFKWDTWTESNLWALFSTVLSRFPKLQLAFIFDLKQFKEHKETIETWLTVLTSFLRENSANFIHIVANEKVLDDTTLTPSTILDVGLESDDAPDTDLPLTKFTQAKIGYLIKNVPRLKLLRDERVHSALLERARLLGNSFTTTDHIIRYLGLHTPHILAPNSILDQIDTSPKSLADLYANQIRELKEHPHGLWDWCNLGLSWILHSFRPLRVEEIAVAVAIGLVNQPPRSEQVAIKNGEGSLIDLGNRISRGIELDLDQHIGLFIRIENGLVHPSRTRSELKKILKEADPQGYLESDDHTRLTRLCLHYLKVALLHFEVEEDWEKYLRHLSSPWKGEPCPRQVVHCMEFLNYAARTWIDHYSHANNAQEDKELDSEVIEFLENEVLRKRWLQVYFAGSPNVASGSSDTNLVSFASQAERLSTNITPEAALDVASHFGLSSIAKALGEKFKLVLTATHEVTIYYGSWTHQKILQDGSSEELIRALICNGDLPRLKESLASTKLNDPQQLARWIYLAAQTKQRNVLQYLVGAKDCDILLEPNSLYAAVVGGSPEIFQDILRQRETTADTGTTAASHYATAIALAVELGSFTLLNELKPETKPVPLDRSVLKPIHLSSMKNLRLIETFLGNGTISAGGTGKNLCSGWTALDFAALSGNTEVIRFVIESQKSKIPEIIDARNDFGMTALHVASVLGSTDVVIELLRLNAKKLTVDSQGSPSDLAARYGHLKTLEQFSPLSSQLRTSAIISASKAGQWLILNYLLVEIDPPVRVKPDSASPYEACMIEAAKHGYPEVVRLLLAAKVNPDCEDSEQRRTALHYAAKEGHFDVAQILINEGANIDPCDLPRNTPLHLATANGRADVVQLLIKNKADVNARNRSKNAPLHLAISYPKIVHLLLESGADVNAADSSRRTPLSIACQRKGGHKEVVQILLQGGADITASDSDDKTPLRHAIESEYIPVVQAICEHDGLFVRQSKEKVLNTLSWAIQSESASLFEFLLRMAVDKGVEIMELRDYFNRNILHLAARYSSTLLRTILEWEPKLHSESSIDDRDNDQYTPLCESIYYGNLEATKSLFEFGASIDVRVKQGWTPLHIGYDYPDIAEFLLSKGADVNALTDLGTTTLMLTCTHGFPLTTEVFLKHGADIERENNEGETAFHISVVKQNEEIIGLLLDHMQNSSDPIITRDAQLSKKTKSGYTALHLAVRQDNSDIVALLLEKESDLKEKADSGQTCLDLIMEREASGENKTLTLLLSEAQKISPPPWEYPDFEQILEKHFNDALDERIFALLDAEPTLVHSDALAALLLKSKPVDSKFEETQESLAVRLVERGLDPFKVPSDSKLTIFQSSVFCQHRIPLAFIEACRSKLSEDDLSKLGDGFRELRIAIECRDEKLWQSFESLRESASLISDEDGWTLDHLIQQTRVPFAKILKVPKTETLTPSSLILPGFWKKQHTDKDVDTTYELSNEGCEVTFKDRRQYSDGNRTWSEFTLRSNHPFPPNDNYHSYFEIEIQEDGIESDLSEEIVVIMGLCAEFSLLSNACPGWEQGTVGYHGDDGGIYEESGSWSYQRTAYGVGNVVGCGVDYKTGEYYFTHDGKLEDRCQKRNEHILFRKLYPVVGHCGRGCKVSINFGQKPFKWKGEKSTPGARR